MAERRIPQVSATRWRIIEILKRAGQATVKDLCGSMGMTDTGVRQHLALLERDGFVYAHKLPSRMGRPSYAYALTDAGLNLFPKQYARFARWILEEVRGTEGEDAVADLLHGVAQRIGRSYASLMPQGPLSVRVRRLTEMLGEDGALAEWSEADGGYFIDAYNCPYSDLAGEYPSVCAMEEEIFRSALGTEVEHTECMARGDPRCRHFVRLSQE